MNPHRDYSMNEMRAYRIRTYTAQIVPPTMLLAALGVVLTFAGNWARGNPNIGAIGVSAAITTILILVLAPLVRRTAASGRTYMPAILGLISVFTLAIHANVATHYNQHGLNQSLPLCMILAVSSTFFWVWPWQLALGLIAALSPAVAALYIDNYSAEDRIVDAQSMFVTVVVCIAFFVSLRRLSMRNYSLMMEVEYRASFDPLTGLLNRAGWFDLAGKAMISTVDGALLFVDLNHFKDVNDRDGHVAGDQMLQRVADLLRDSGAPPELIGRFGGDEFVIYLPGASAVDAWRRAERIRAAFASLHEVVSTLSASVGVAVREPGDDLDALVHRADEAMFAEKAKRRMTA